MHLFLKIQSLFPNLLHFTCIVLCTMHYAPSSTHLKSAGGEVSYANQLQQGMQLTKIS